MFLCLTVDGVCHCFKTTLWKRAIRTFHDRWTTLHLNPHCYWTLDPPNTQPLHWCYVYWTLYCGIMNSPGCVWLYISLLCSNIHYFNMSINHKNTTFHLLVSCFASFMKCSVWGWKPLFDLSALCSTIIWLCVILSLVQKSAPLWRACSKISVQLVNGQHMNKPLKDWCLEKGII